MVVTPIRILEAEQVHVKRETALHISDAEYGADGFDRVHGVSL